MKFKFKFRCDNKINIFFPFFDKLQAMQEALNLNPDTDMNEWFMEREMKMPGVIYHDKLISDALLGQTPIKSEHSYSLNSDGDSIPDSPRSLQNKIDGKSKYCIV